MLRRYVVAGHDPHSFWTLTPRLFSIVMEAAAEKARHEHQARAWVVWHTAALSRVPKMPDFDEFAGIKAKRQTSEELQMNLKMLAAAWGAVH